MRSFICCGNQELLKGATCVYILHGSSTIAVVDPGGFIGFHGTPLLKGCLRKYQYAQTYYIHYAHTRATHFSFTLAITHNLPVHVNSIISCIKNSMRAWPTCTYILSEAHGNHRDNERSEEQIKAKFFFIRAMHPLQLGMAICYQYERTYFPAPYADNQLLCSLCDTKRSHASDSAGSKYN